jgi:uncharacterized membrane protein YhaH (DUF805 family)
LPELWYRVLFTILGGVVASIFDAPFFWTFWPATSNTLLSYVFGLVVFLPGIAVVARRRHENFCATDIELRAA